jgi:hypothetical protein
MPDGSKIEIGAAHYRAPEILFRPDLIGEECDGAAQCVANAIFVGLFGKLFYLIFIFFRNVTWICAKRSIKILF